MKVFNSKATCKILMTTVGSLQLPAQYVVEEEKDPTDGSRRRKIYVIYLSDDRRDVACRDFGRGHLLLRRRKRTAVINQVTFRLDSNKGCACWNAEFSTYILDIIYRPATSGTFIVFTTIPCTIDS